MTDYRFTRYVNGKEKAEGVLVHADNLREAWRKAVDLVYTDERPVTILTLDTDLLAAANARADLLQANIKVLDNDNAHLMSRIAEETARADAAEAKVEKLRDRGPRVTSPLSTPEQAAYNKGFNDCRKSVLEQSHE